MIRVLIVDNLIAENVHSSRDFSTVIKEQPDMLLIGHYTSANQALPELGDVDVLIVGTNLAKDGAYWLIQTIGRVNNHARPLVMGQTETNETIIRFFEAGACGFVRRNDPAEELPEKIRRAANGEAILSQEILPGILTRLAELAQCFEVFRVCRANLPV